MFASVGLWVSGSHDLGEIACEIVCNLMTLFAAVLFVGCDIRTGDAGDEVISKSHKCMDLSPVDGSLFSLFLLLHS